ncbi:MAG: hypothetical protein ACREIA_10445 [Opitutaceae bacterium]
MEVTREVTVLEGKDRGRHHVETALLVSSLPIAPQNALLLIIRGYWGIEAGHHRLDVTAREDAGRVRNSQQPPGARQSQARVV